ncbi:MAG: hypothetical protein GY719_23225 [bacterium]|nr:hypothetical protein [bacterium]
MDISTWRREHRGPFRSHQLGDGEGYELTNGHPVPCLPPTPFKAGLRLSVAQMLGADPAVEWAATGLGFSPDPMTLRAPDIMVWIRAQSPGAPEPPALSKKDRLRISTALLLNTDPAVEWAGTAAELTAGPRALTQDDSGKPDWITQPPLMAVELVEEGRDEGDLEQKIHELIEGGVRALWVARYAGPRRVEVHAPGQSPRSVAVERNLTASGILSCPIPALAFFDRNVALEQVLRRELEIRGEGDSRAVDA